MVKQPSELALNSHWAYRHGYYADLQEVRVVKLGVKRPRWAFVSFVASEDEGVEMWTPIGRLKCPWDDVERFKDIERKWDAAAAASSHASDVEAEAVSLVCGYLDKTCAINYWAGNIPGVTAIADPQALAKLHSLDWDSIADELSFEDNDELVLSLPATLQLARRLALSDPHGMLVYLEGQVDSARHIHLEAVRNDAYPYRRMTLNGTSTTPLVEDVIAAVELIKEWLGEPQVEEWNEVSELRAEIARLSSIINKAATVLHQNGMTRDASAIRRLHGLSRYPLPRLKSYYEMTREMKNEMS